MATVGDTCLPFVWRTGVMTPLPLLGGDNGAGYSINNRGQIVGAAEIPRMTQPARRPKFSSYGRRYGKRVRSENSLHFPATLMQLPEPLMTRGRRLAGRGRAL